MNIELTKYAKILIIRRDNIGDLLLSTPLIHSIRQQYPSATIDVLVNSYNAPIITNNKDISNILVYTKAKHRKNHSLLSVYLGKLSMFMAIRRARYDLTILTATKNPIRDYRLARIASPRKILAFSNSINPKISHAIDYLVDNSFSGTMHFVDELHYLATALGIRTKPGPLVLNEQSTKISNNKEYTNAGVVGIHISSRKESQRWPIENFSNLMSRLFLKGTVKKFILFWSPGSADNPTHPGDDQHAEQLLALTQKLPITAYPTHNLDQLITGMNLIDCIICSDGGAMHIAAALNKPILCFFGNSDPVVWHPWKVPYQLIQKISLDVKDISVDDALSAWTSLSEQLSVSP